MRSTIIAVALLLAVRSPLFAQNAAADEKAIRDLVAKVNSGTNVPGLATPDYVQWSGALVKPAVGSAKPEFRPGSSAGSGRTDVKNADTIVQLHVASSGDMAYEYGTFKGSWVRSDNKQKVDVEGAYLRTWRKVDGSWKLAASFRHPYDPTATTR